MWRRCRGSTSASGVSAWRAVRPVAGGEGRGTAAPPRTVTIQACPGCAQDVAIPALAAACISKPAADGEGRGRTTACFVEPVADNQAGEFGARAYGELGKDVPEVGLGCLYFYYQPIGAKQWRGPQWVNCASL